MIPLFPLVDCYPDIMVSHVHFFSLLLLLSLSSLQNQYYKKISLIIPLIIFTYEWHFSLGVEVILSSPKPRIQSKCRDGKRNCFLTHATVDVSQGDTPHSLGTTDVHIHSQLSGEGETPYPQICLSADQVQTPEGCLSPTETVHITVQSSPTVQS